MDVEWITIISSILSSFGVSGFVVWLVKRSIENKFDRDKIKWQGEVRLDVEKDLATWRGEVRRDVEKELDSWRGEIRKQVEIELGDEAANREYTLEARKRLYAAIGPLRFQLLLSCRDLASRIRNYGLGTRYVIDPMHSTNNYYGQSMLFRLVRPLAISELIEKQMFFADFSVDPTSIALLRFKMRWVPHCLTVTLSLTIRTHFGKTNESICTLTQLAESQIL